MPCSPSSSCSELAQFSWGHREVFCSKQVPIQRPGLVLSNFSKWLLKHYFRWNEKQNQKQCFDWIQGLYWTLPPHSSLLFFTFCSLVPTPSFSSLCLMLMNTHSHFPSFFSSFHVFPSVYSSFYLSFHSPLSSIVSCPTPNLFQQLFVSTPFLFHTFSFGSFTIITFFLLFDILNFFVLYWL